MSDMNPGRITIRIPEELSGKLRHRSRLNGQSESDLVRTALETYLGHADGALSAYEAAAAAGIIGCVRAPKDLSTNSRHFDGFGKNK